MCLHAGYNPVGDDAVYGLGQGAPRGVPLHRTAPYQVRPRFRVVTPRDRDSESPISVSSRRSGRPNAAMCADLPTFLVLTIARFPLPLSF